LEQINNIDEDGEKKLKTAF